MKHQYFGDINDYRKYGLLRALAEASGLPLGVYWLLTADDQRTDGEFRQYLEQPSRWRKHDPGLYDRLQKLREPGVARSVDHAETWELLPGARYFADLLEDGLDQRRDYFRRSWEALAGCPLLFFDPDNGLEVQSVRRGSRGSCKYVYWAEVKEAYRRGHSMVIYQHWPRAERQGYTSRLVEECRARLGGVVVDTFATAHVLFLLAARPEHAAGFERAHHLILERWAGQIAPMAHGAGNGAAGEEHP